MKKGTSNKIYEILKKDNRKLDSNAIKLELGDNIPDQTLWSAIGRLTRAGLIKIVGTIGRNNIYQACEVDDKSTSNGQDQVITGLCKKLVQLMIAASVRTAGTGISFTAEEKELIKQMAN